MKYTTFTFLLLLSQTTIPTPPAPQPCSAVVRESPLDAFLLSTLAPGINGIDEPPGDPSFFDTLRDSLRAARRIYRAYTAASLPVIAHGGK